MTRSLAFIFALWSTFAWADPRTIDFTQVILDADGQPFTECVEGPQRPDCVKRDVTLGLVVMRSLSMPEQNLKPEDGLLRGKLALRLYKAKDEHVTAEELTLIKAQIAKAWGPLIVARTFALLDPEK